MSKSNQELALELERLHGSADDGDKVTCVLLFGIKYANCLNRENTQAIVRLSGIPKLGPTVNMGRRLAKHVDLKNPDWPN